MPSALIAALAVLVGFVVIIALKKSSDGATNAAADPTASTPTPTALGAAQASGPVHATDTPPPSEAPPVEQSGGSQRAVAASAEYSGPGGITVTGPAGWNVDGAVSDASVVDYNEPGSPARLAGQTFRIGIGNSQPTELHREARQAANFLSETYDATILRGPYYTQFLDTEAANIVYQYYNTEYGLERRGIERIWHYAGVTYIIQSSGPAQDWTLTKSRFAQLASSASID